MADTTHERPRSVSASAAQRIRRLVLVYVEGHPELAGRAWTVTAAGLVLRRETEEAAEPTDARIPSAQVSRQAHAALVFDERLGTVQVRDEGRPNGTRLDGRPLPSGAKALLKPGSVIGVGDALLVYSEYAPAAPLPIDDASDVSLARAYAERLVELAASSDLPVLILGPTGAGKERLAQAFHAATARSGPFVAINCAGIPTELLASELFGHKRGAFTGADEKVGLLEAADGGTLFLDEVADLPVDQQSALLRALQERRIRRLGATRDVAIDVRLVTATSRDLDAMEQDGRARSDFVGRISGVRVVLPGLSERREEILPLFRLFLSRVMRDGAAPPPLTFAAAEKLLTYDWPKNVRELEHAAKAAALFAKMVPSIDVALLPSAVQQAGALVVDDDARVSREVLVELLRRHAGNVTRVAETLGQSRQKVHRWMNGYGIEPESYRR